MFCDMANIPSRRTRNGTSPTSVRMCIVCAMIKVNLVRTVVFRFYIGRRANLRRRTVATIFYNSAEKLLHGGSDVL